MKLTLIAICMLFVSACAAPGEKPDNPTGADFERRAAGVKAELDSRVEDHKAELLYLAAQKAVTSEEAILKMIAALQMKVEKLCSLHYGGGCPRGWDGKFPGELEQ